VKLLFKEYDKNKSGFLEISELKLLMKKLLDDECIIGKVPKMNEAEIEIIFDNWDKNADGKINWVEFR
jgi:Ca2+-binding EF-hand superfamily protein